MSGEEISRMSLDELLVRNRSLRAQFSDDPGLQEELQALQRWQAGRLERTYADLQERERYRPGVEFFLEELYTDKDYLPRDTQLERASPILKRMLPAQAQESMRMAVQLEVLSQELDGEMTRALGAGTMIDEQSYAEAYRTVGRRDDRERQIGFILEAGRDLERLVKLPMIYTLIRMAHGPAHLAGFGALHDFLEDGFRAFRAMDGAEEFLQAIEDRETRIMERIFAEHPQPFRLADDEAPPTQAPA
ncbi:FFLEELY motif protein [Lentisalinibacter orientalis]|uniref:FFLEELY motif protein n=1 Tax=Lentisalinibacter orientalis TaxID=2992241 RepID=UPI00386A2BF2